MLIFMVAASLSSSLGRRRRRRRHPPATDRTDPSLGAALLGSEASRPPPGGPGGQLSQGEQDVLRLIALGASVSTGATIRGSAARSGTSGPVGRHATERLRDLSLRHARVTGPGPGV